MNSPSSFRINFFGTPSVQAADGSLVSGPVAQRHRIALLALLAFHGARGATRDRLIGDLWPESGPGQARQLLNQSVYQLRKALGDTAVLSTGDELRLNPDALCVDVAEFELLLARGDARAAVALYRGPLLDGFFLGGAPGFEQRIAHERQRLGELYGNALEALAEAAERDRDFHGAAGWWRVRSGHDPYDSRTALRLMQALDAGGNRAGALQHAAQHARLLQDEFGIAPPPELEMWLERVRAVGAARTNLDEPGRPASHAAEPPIPGPPEARQGDARPEVGDTLPAGAAAPAAEAAAPAELAKRDADRPARRRLRTAAGAVALGAVAMSVYWAASRDDDIEWLLRDALPRIEEHLAVADWEAAFELAEQAEERVPGSREVAELWPRVSWVVSLESEPAGATVFRQAWDAPDEPWQELGRTPLREIRIPYGLSRLRFELDGYRSSVRALGGAHINWRELKAVDPDRLLVGPDVFRLDPNETLPPGMVRVPGGRIEVGGDIVPVEDFFLGEYEVTNAEYRAFVEAGGYRRPELWDPVVADGEVVPWRAAMDLFVDRTGRPGPSTWEGGDYPQMEADFPVSGVSWYEAAAYARYAGHELPTAHHWQHALANALFPWLLPASNFSGQRLRRVTEGHAMTHVGAYDMTGNVREWTATPIGDERIILGGSWNDPYYIAGTTDTSAPLLDRSADNGFRLALTRDEPAHAALLRAPMMTRTTAPPVPARQPVSDEVYAAYSRVFDYDRRPLEAVTESIDTTRVWIRQRITFGAAYGTERMILHLYLPTAGSAPYQTVIYWPGWDTFTLDDADEYFAKQVDFLVRAGRAVAFPIYLGTFERHGGSLRRRPDFGTAEYRDNTIHTVKDLRRTVDYLQTRPDIDQDALAFFGYSWGGVNGPVALAQEPRIRASVINIGLLPPMAATPEVDPLHALPRVRIPTLMFSSEFDPMVPLANSRQYFELLATPAADKRQVVAIGGHFIPRHLVIRETLDWFDRYLGPVRR